MNEKHPSELTLDDIEKIEKLTLRWIFQSVTDFGMEAHEILLKSPDSVKDIAEDHCTGQFFKIQLIII